MECAIAQQLRGAAVQRICAITEPNKYEGVRCPRKGFEDFTGMNFIDEKKGTITLDIEGDPLVYKH